MTPADTLREALRCGRTGCACSRGKNTHCPSHDDAAPSLSITDGRTAPLFKCFSGCETKAIILALTERGLWPLDGERKVVPIRTSNEPDHLYRYVTAEGELVGEKGRWDNPKTFKWRKPGERWGESRVLMQEMPLYGLPNVIQSPNAPVWMVEGEKAQQACVSRGLVAVCLAGGASQSSFGDALAPLLDREVILWPDNDAPGQALMAKIAGLLPDVKYVRPPVPEKGDAHDYFAQGGTVEGLQALLREGEPVVRSIAADAVEVVMPHPAGSVTFTFAEMTWAKHATEAQMGIDVRVTGVPRAPYSTRINLSSSSGRDGIRREVEQVFGKSSIEWSRMISTATSEADRVWKEIDLSVELSEVETRPRQWFLDQRIPSEAVSIIFGSGGSMKSLILLDMALHSLMDAQWLGIPLDPVYSVLVVDYEDTADEWRARAESICQANGWAFPAGRMRYLPGNAIPIHEHASRIRNLVRHHRIGLVIVDSASSASGGDLIDTTSVSRVVNFLQSLGVTVLMTAHNTKVEDSAHPYGSVMWTNLVRATHYVEQRQEDGSRQALATIYNRKANRGRQRPIGVRVDFPDSDDGPIEIARDDTAVQQTANPDAAGTVAWRIHEWLTGQSEPQPTGAISDALDISPAHVRRELDRRADMFTKKTDGRQYLWCARSYRQEPA